MYTNNDPRKNHLANNAQSAMQNHLREQEDRKRALKREQDTRELRKYEADLHTKQQEFTRVKTQLDRLKREAVQREAGFKKDVRDVQQEKSLKELEIKLSAIDKSVQQKIHELNLEIERKKQELSRLEKQKVETLSQGESQKKSINSNLSVVRSKFDSASKQKESEKRLFEMTQTQITQYEQSMKQFSQEISVLENKVKALKIALR